MFPLLCLGSCVNICQIQFSLWTFRQSYMKHHLFFARHYPTRTLCSCPSESQAVNFKTHFNDFFSPAHIFEYHPYLQIKTPLFQQKLPSFNTSGVWCGALPIESLGISIRWLQIWWYYLDVIPLSWQHALQEMEVEPVTVSGRTHGPIAHSNYSTGWLVKTKPFEEKQQQYRICDEWLSYFVLSQAS